MTIEEKLQTLPEKPGVYIMRDSSDTIIYIGKAVILKNRVRQYFTHSQKQEKVRAMVENVADFDYFVTLTEKDALALEANLIKKHKPRYNILLKDDKQSPYIKIDLKLDFPCLEITRKVKRDGARYFGPYFNGLRVKEIVEIVRSAYQIRGCARILKKQKRACLNYQIGLCDAPCMGYISKEDYRIKLNKAIHFLSGYEESAEALIEEKMLKAAEAEEFETALKYRDRLKMIKRIRERTIANLGAIGDTDFFGYSANGINSAAAVVIVRGNKMIGVKNYALTDASIEKGDALISFIMQYYAVGQNNSIPEEIAVEEGFDTTALKEYLNSISDKKVTVTSPQKGKKKMLIKTANANAENYLVKSVSKKEHENEMTYGANEKLRQILGLEKLRRIECYDISHISGVDKVASGVCFIDGAPSKSDYRRYRIKTVEGSDDFASLNEVIRRRLMRASEDEKFSELPDLFIIDGGKGQLSSAYAAMKECGYDIPMVGLAKREEEIFTIYSSDPIIIPHRDYALRLVQRVRDETHRFAITYHRNLRSKRYLSELEDIKNVGTKKLKLLYENFKTTDAIKNASIDDLVAIKGIDKTAAKNIYEYFNGKADS